MFQKVCDIELCLSDVTEADKISKIETVQVFFELSNSKFLIHRLFNVYYVSQCSVNLISTARIRRIDNIYLNMETDELYDQETREIKALVKKINNLFELKTAYVFAALLSTSMTSSEMWHR